MQWERVQPRIRRLGGIAGLAQGVILLSLMFVNARIFSLFPAKADPTAPKVFLPVVAQQPLAFILHDLLYALLGITVALLALALFDLLGSQVRSMSLPATAAGLLAALLFLVYGLYGMIRLPMLASDYVHHPVTRDPAFTSYLALTNALLLAGVVILGIWFVASSWAAVRAKALGRVIAYVGLSWGVLALLSPIEDVGLYALGQELLWPIWAFWIGATLLRPVRPVLSTESDLEPPPAGAALPITQESGSASEAEPAEGEHA